MNPTQPPQPQPGGQTSPGGAAPHQPAAAPATTTPPLPHQQPTPAPPAPPMPPGHEHIPDNGSSGGRLRHIISGLISWVVIPVVIVLVLHTFVFQAFYVEGSSMEPDFHSNDYLIVSKVDLTWHNFKSMFGVHDEADIQRGDVLVFRPPIAPYTYFVKRVIGLPGERVQIAGGKVTIYNKQHPNGFELKESYIDQSQLTLGDVNKTVDPGHYFMMGDNRHPSGSYDSRDWGLLPVDNIIGVAYMRLLPVSNLGQLSHPDYPTSPAPGNP